MDIIGTILARNGIKEIKASGGVGYTTQNIASFVIPAAEEVTSDVSLRGFNFKWFSSLTPTQEEFLAGTWIISKDGKSLSYPIKNFANVAATANGAYCVNMGGHLYIVSTVLENELGKLPKTGMYYSTTLSNDDENSGLTYIFEFAETIHPIDPKYLPTINLNDYGIDVASLVMSGGGTVEYTDELALKCLDDIKKIQPVYCLMEFEGRAIRCVVGAHFMGQASFNLSMVYMGNLIKATIAVYGGGSSLKVTATTDITPITS